ncbi:hypothetical protein QBC38DRAFT_242227 [Podospora fimiseda]|uniref:Uncharacterized protein n=1 Tax=Podospora fimiseda TaxID=252190 RepID=A0AAN7H7V0_9PEZI|nr:hypothetical protein QBC38DRAFT_242227 [Podospora fimiseda]
MDLSVDQEKAILRQHYEQQDDSLAGPASSSSSPGTNTVPMTVEELESSPVHQSPPPVRSPTPPPYSGPSTPAQQSPTPPNAFLLSHSSQPRRYPGLPPLDYRLYNPPLFTLSQDKTTIRSSVPYLSSNATALIALIRQQASIPPKPCIHITGRREHSASSRPDFAIKLNLMHLLIPDDQRNRLDYLRCVAPGEMVFRGGSKPSLEPSEPDGLEEWARRYVDDKSANKSFLLERVVANLDVNWVEGQVRALVAEMKYPGRVEVKFLVTHNKVMVQAPEKGNKFLASVAGLFSGGKKKYEVVKAVWPFASGRNGEKGRKVVCGIGEEEWWKGWKRSVRFAISAKRHGWVTNEDKLEVLMEADGDASGNVDWGPEEGIVQGSSSQWGT